MEHEAWEEGITQTDFTNNCLTTIMMSMTKEDELLRKQKGTWTNIVIWEYFLEDEV